VPHKNASCVKLVMEHSYSVVFHPDHFFVVRPLTF
jgi:hypothetical protein